MVLQSGPPPSTPDLVREAARAGRKLILWGGLSIGFAVLVTLVTAIGALVGVVAPFLLCFVLFLGPVGLLLLPFGLYAWLVPTSHQALSPLGDDAEQRRRAAESIAEAIASPDTQFATLSKGRMFYLTPQWAVFTGRGELVVFERELLLHAWVNATVHRTMIVFTSKTYELVIRTAKAGKFKFDTPECDLEGLMECLQAANPSALFGYDERLAKLSDDELVELMARRDAS